MDEIKKNLLSVFFTKEVQFRVMNALTYRVTTGAALRNLPTQ